MCLARVVRRSRVQRYASSRSRCFVQAKKSPPKSKEEAPNYVITQQQMMLAKPLLLIGQTIVKSRLMLMTRSRFATSGASSLKKKDPTERTFLRISIQHLHTRRCESALLCVYPDSLIARPIRSTAGLNSIIYLFLR